MSHTGTVMHDKIVAFPFVRHYGTVLQLHGGICPNLESRSQDLAS